MNKIYFLKLLALYLILACNANATVHMVNVADFSFSPSSMNVVVGDTVMWMWVSGTHTTTSTSVPTGAATWNANINSANSFFNYKVTVAGTYNYFCAVHPTLMTGSFTATAVGIDELTSASDFVWHISDKVLSVSMNMHSASDGSINLYSVVGKQVKTLATLHNVQGTYKEYFSLLAIPAGTYMLEVTLDRKRAIKKIIIE
jgi:plastocyanin